MLETVGRLTAGARSLTCQGATLPQLASLAELILVRDGIASEAVANLVLWDLKYWNIKYWNIKCWDLRPAAGRNDLFYLASLD